MKTSKSNNVFLSQSMIQAWPFTPSKTETTSVECCTACGNSLERQRLKERLTEAQRDALCVTRAVRLMAFLTAFAVICLGHATVFLPFWPQTMEQYLMQWPIKACCVLGLASFSCAIAFSRLRQLYHRELNWCLEQCRSLMIEPPDLDPIISLVPAPFEQSDLSQEAVALKEAA